MEFNIISIFPNIFDSYINESIIKRAQKEKHIKIKTHNLRDWTKDKHKTVDDTPYGGGAGMVMKIEPLYQALCTIKSQITNPKNQKPKTKTILLSAKGKTWNQQMARDYARLDNVTMICGRYEGVDERVMAYIDEEISIGDYVMTGGELGAMVIIDSITRLLPGVLGNDQSAIDESHSTTGLLEYPQYTRPEIFIDKENQEQKVPEILLSGNHAEIDKWRKKQKKKNY